MHLQAWQVAEKLPPFQTWAGADARCLAGRLASALGNPSWQRRLHLRAWKEAPAHPEAFYHYIVLVLETRGALAGWQLLKKSRQFFDTSPRLQAKFLCLRARLAGHLRDFETADAFLAQVGKLGVDKMLLLVERAWLLQKQDRYDEALECGQEAMSSFSPHPAAAHLTAHLLQLQQQDAEAAALLQRVAGQLEDASILAQLATLQIELGKPEEARQSLQRYDELTPLRNGAANQWLSARRADAAYVAGDFAAVGPLATAAKEPFYTALASRCAEALAHGETLARHRQLLNVPFVRQHHVTCAPATLTALSRFWGRSTEHLQVAEKICYNGTSSSSQRRWADEEGFYTREFKLTPECARALIQRGIPIALATAEAEDGHLQAVTGYDALRECLLIRDPYLRNLREFRLQTFFKRYAASGPRAMILVPPEQKGLLDGIELPEAELYEQLKEFEGALQRNERTQARAVAEALEREHPGHRLTLWAGALLAGFDANVPEQLKFVDLSLAQFPSDARLLLWRLSCLRQLAPRADRLKWLQNICEQPEADPALMREYAAELAEDPATASTARKWLRRAGENAPRSPTSKPGAEPAPPSNEEILEKLRFAACLEDKDERHAMAYFDACQRYQKREVGLQFLRDRFERFGPRSSRPAQTFVHALLNLRRIPEALKALDQALAWRPEDPELLPFAIGVLTSQGELRRGEGLLETLRGKAREGVWHRCAARLAARRGELTAAVRAWQTVHELEPLALDAHRAIVALLEETDCRAAAREHLERVADEFPHAFALHEFRAEWLRYDLVEVAEAAAQKLLAINAANPAGHLELATVRRRQRRLEDAAAAADQAVALAPEHVGARCLRGWIRLDLGRRTEARADFLKAISITVEYPPAVSGLLAASKTTLDSAGALTRIETALAEQRWSPDGLLAFQTSAQSQFEPAELLRLLQATLTAQPDCWQAWAAVIHQLSWMGHNDAAHARAEEAVKKFPDIAELHYAFGCAQQARQDTDGAVASFVAAQKLEPANPITSRRLAWLYAKSNRLNDAIETLQAALVRSPADSGALASLAAMETQRDDSREAFQLFQQAARLDLNHAWAWSSLRSLGAELKQTNPDIELAQAISRERPKDPRVWLFLADLHDDAGQAAEAMAAVERALAVAPSCAEAYDAKARRLAETGRYDEASRMVHPLIFGDTPPMQLRMRAALIEAQRGKVTEATLTLRKLLEEAPDYLPCWRALAHWHYSLGDYDQALEAANQVQRLAPLDAEVACWLGGFERASGHHESARAHFRRALQCDPGCEQASLGLFDLHYRAQQYVEAETLLRSMRTRRRSAPVAAREILLMLYRGDANDAISVFCQLCVGPAQDSEALNEAVDALLSAGLGAPALKVIDAALDTEEANPSLASFWCKVSIALGKLPDIHRLDRLVKRGEIGRRGLITCIGILGVAGQSGTRELSRAKCRRALQGILRHHGEWLAKDAAGWPAVALALGRLDLATEALRWMNNWSTQPSLSRELLFWHARNLKRRGQEAQAAEVCRHALSLPEPGSSVTPALTLWLAQAEALEGNYQTAAKLLEQVPFEVLDSYFQEVYVLVRSLVEVGKAPTLERSVVYERNFKKLQDVYGPRLRARTDRAQVAAFRGTMAKLSELSGGWRLRLWAAMRMH
jgi:tetratricopeptide (TPR) repeat protein